MLLLIVATIILVSLFLPVENTNIPNTSTSKKKIKDTDGDGIPDNEDTFPDDPSEWKDSDGDGVGDNSDSFPYDPTEQKDSDGDGVGDNSDTFPYDPKEQKDYDHDGIGNNADINPYVNLSITITIQRFKVTSHVDLFRRAQVYFEIWVNGEKKQVFNNNGRYWRVWIGREEIVDQSFTYDIPDTTKEKYTTIEIKMFDHDFLTEDDPIDVNNGKEAVIIRFNNVKNVVSGGNNGISKGEQGVIWYNISYPSEITPPEEYYTRLYRWIFQNKTWSLKLDIPVSKYKWCLNSKVNREPQLEGIDAMASFVTYRDKTVETLVDKLRTLGKGFDDIDYINFALSFVQQIVRYTDDNVSKGEEEYWRYPIEILVEMEGDCEDSAVLFASIIKASNYNVSLLFYVIENNTGHLAVGVNLDTAIDGYYILYNDSRYYYCETTSMGYLLGDKPSGIPDKPEMVIPIR